MEWSKVLSGLNKLNANVSTKNPQKLLDTCERNVELARAECIPNAQEHTTAINNLCNDSSMVWQCIRLNLEYLLLLRERNETFTVQQTKLIKNAIDHVTEMGIIANLAYPKPVQSVQIPENISVLTRYERLAATTYGLHLCLKSIELKLLIVQDNLRWILSGLYQILFCPLKKPSSSPDSSGFLMTEEIYQRLLKHRELFHLVLCDIQAKTHPRIYMRATMLITGNNSPLWLKRALSATLDRVIRGPKGLQSVAGALLDATGLDDACDTARSWQALDAIAKIVLDMRKSPDFPSNVCNQLTELLAAKNRNEEFIPAFEQLFGLCVKMLYVEDEEMCVQELLPHVFAALHSLSTDSKLTEGDDITALMSQSIRLISLCFIEEKAGVPLLPLRYLTNVADLLFVLYIKTLPAYDSVMMSVNGDIKTILIRLLRNAADSCLVLLFDTLVYQLTAKEVQRLTSGLDIVVDRNRFMVKLTKYSVTLSCLERAESLQQLIKGDPQLIASLFAYLLHCLIERDKYFRSTTDSQLLNFETDAVLDRAMERNIATFKLLADIAEDKDVQKYIGEQPDDVIKYIDTVYRRTLAGNVHQMTEFENSGFQSVFIISMLLQVLVENASKETIKKYAILRESLQRLVEEGTNSELREILKNVLARMDGSDVKQDPAAASTKSKLDVILEDIYDPLLPVRGHGLMALTKLISDKDQDALERKQFILNVFQQNLKQDDSFIYLSAISGLAAMADIFTDSVLTVLTDEYSEFDRNTEDTTEIKMKIGEVLVRVTKLLGEMAPKYKSILLNCFLNGTKDEDHLIRASSLSNLGEVCRVLGYKLGTIVSEVLSCVHAILSTDKAIEPRRAAVMVIKQLFVGLEKETIVFLKDDILPIYRQLKHIYNCDKDDVMRLQAQLALEELNRNVQDFVFPHLALHNEKSFIRLT